VRRARGIAGKAGRFYWEAGLADDVPALAWTLMTMLVPLALGLGAVATLIFDRASVADFARHAANVFPKAVHDQVVALVLETRRDSPLLVVVAIAVMLWTGSNAIGVIERALSRLLARQRAGTVGRKLEHLSLAAGLVVLIALIVLAVTETTALRHGLGLDSPAIGLLGIPVIGAAAVGVCGALYRLAPRGEIPWRAALAGGVPAALVLLATPTAARYYVGGVARGSAIGVFLVLVGVLVTCYVAAIGMIVGAGVAARVALGHPLPSSQPQPRAEQAEGLAGD
jgi:uncharacterized BrkB/YihY/UPF0761 family membrane protein